MELYHLRYILKLARLLHFSQAARELNITQPYLSQCVAQAEQELGVKLFERKTRSVCLTESGEAFVLNAEKVLRAWQDLLEDMHNQSLTNKGLLRVGTLLNMSRLDLNNQVLAFQKEHPHIRVTLGEIVGSFELIQQLESGVYDIVFFIPSTELKLNSEVDICPVLYGHVVAVMPAEHRLAGKRAISMSDLAEENLLFPGRAHSLHGTLMSACRNSNFEPKIISQSSLVVTNIKMAAQGMGIALLSSQFSPELDNDALRVIPIEPLIARTIHLAYLKQSAHSAAVRAFRDFIVQIPGGAKT